MAVPCCPECGAEKIDMVEMSGLEAHFNPPLVYYKGDRLKLTTSEARMIYTLVRRRRVSSDALAILPNGEYAPQESVRCRFTSIRKVFAASGVPFALLNIHGYGYEIKEVVA